MNAEAAPVKTRKKPGRKPRAKDTTLTRRELAVNIHKKLGKGSKCSAALVLDIVQLTIDCLADAMLEGRHIEFRDFGVFEVLTRRSRLGRNPNDPLNTVVIPARRTVKFKLSRKMMERLAAAKPVAQTK